MQTVIPVRPAVFETENRIAVFIANEDVVNKLIRRIPERRWSPSHGYWHFPKTEKHWATFKELFKDFDLNIQAELPPLSIPASEMIERPKLKPQGPDMLCYGSGYYLQLYPHSVSLHE